MVCIPGDWFVQTYSLDLSKTIARPKLYGAYPMLMPSLRGGEILYTDVKGYEDIWRKHAVSPVTRDIWLRSKDGKHTKLTTFGGEDRNAVWDSKGGSTTSVSAKVPSMSTTAMLLRLSRCRQEDHFLHEESRPLPLYCL